MELGRRLLAGIACGLVLGLVAALVIPNGNPPKVDAAGPIRFEYWMLLGVVPLLLLVARASDWAPTASGLLFGSLLLSGSGTARARWVAATTHCRRASAARRTTGLPSRRQCSGSRSFCSWSPGDRSHLLPRVGVAASDLPVSPQAPPSSRSSNGSSACPWSFSRSTTQRR
jgi:hypothetical protein